MLKWLNTNRCFSHFFNSWMRMHFDQFPSRTFFCKRMQFLTFLIKKSRTVDTSWVKTWGLFGELKFLNFLLMRLNIYLSVSVIKELFQHFFFNFTFKITQLLIKIYSCIFFVTHANIQALVLSKKVMRDGHILSSSLASAWIKKFD